MLPIIKKLKIRLNYLYKLKLFKEVFRTQYVQLFQKDSRPQNAKIYFQRNSLDRANLSTPGVSFEII